MISWLVNQVMAVFKAKHQPQSVMIALCLLSAYSFSVPQATYAEDPGLSSGQNEYILDVGDEIRIEDAIMGNLTSLEPTNDRVTLDTARISDEGLIDLPWVGPLHLGGLSLSAAQMMLNRQYGRLLQKPSITIQVITQHPMRVYVQGAVNHPGVYINGKNTQPDNKDHAGLGGVDVTEIYSRYYLTDALIQAGGLKANADYHDIRIVRDSPHPQILHVNLWQLFQQGDSAGDIPLEERDRVEVSELPASQLAFTDDWKSISRTNLGVGLFQVSVIGAVKQPGTYALSASDNPLAAIAQAGGFSPMANPKSVYLLRANENGQVFKKQLDASDDRLMKKGRSNWPSLLPNDVIFVDDSTGRQALAIGKTLIDRTAGASLLPFFSSLSSGSKK
jgi:protein involved in polysaccharide export with SLBB domain